MIGIVHTTPATAEIEALLVELSDVELDDADWVNAEFEAIIAANFDAEPPRSPGPPAGLPARWPRTRGTPRRPGSQQRPVSAVMIGSHHRRQRSPPTT